MSKVDLAIRDTAVQALKTVTEDAELVTAFTAALMESLSQKGGKKPRAKKDPNAPKKALSAFFHYCGEHREKVRNDNKDDDGKPLPVAEASKILSEMWKKLSAKARAKYDKMAADDKVRYEKEMETYKPESS